MNEINDALAQLDTDAERLARLRAEVDARIAAIDETLCQIDHALTITP